MNSYTIDQIERAINIWRARQASGSDAALCRQARVLAEPYALAIFEQRTTINEADLSPEQITAINEALMPSSQIGN
jgi:hypothetical protein